MDNSIRSQIIRRQGSHPQNPYYQPHHDSYHFHQNHKGPLECKHCGLLFENGLFKWEERHGSKCESFECPACRRMKDDFEGGVVILAGSFVAAHQEEINNLIQNVEHYEMTEHPLERIIGINQTPQGLIVRTTYEHLARAIGSAVSRAYKGELKLDYPKDEKYIRVTWTRE